MMLSIGELVMFALAWNIGCLIYALGYKTGWKHIPVHETIGVYFLSVFHLNAFTFWVFLVTWLSM